MNTVEKAPSPARKKSRLSRAEEALSNHARRVERDALLRRFDYDPDAAVEFVLAHARPLRGLVLDIGTGKGRFVVALARRGLQVTTVDISAEEQRIARLEADHAGVAGRIRFIVRDAGRLPWRSARFGAVVSMNAFHHLDDPDRVLAEMRRVLLPGGTLVVADFSASGFRRMDRIHRAEGRTHPHPPSRCARWQSGLQRGNFRVQRFCGCHQQVLVAVGAAPTAGRPLA